MNSTNEQQRQERQILTKGMPCRVYNRFLHIDYFRVAYSLTYLLYFYFNNIIYQIKKNQNAAKIIASYLD